MLLCFNEKVAARSWDETIVTTTAVIASLKANLCSFRLLRESSLELAQFVKIGELRWNGIVRDRSNFKPRKSPSLFSFWAFVRIAVCENYKSSWLMILYFRVRGIITRKDLMGFQMEERIHKFLHSSRDHEMQPPSSSLGHRPSMDA